MNILNSKNILITCIMSLCSIGISFPFHGWSLGNSMWNWTCYFFTISSMVITTILRNICTSKRCSPFSKGEIIGSFVLCILYIHLYNKGINLYDSIKILAAICLYLTFKEIRKNFDCKKIVLYFLFINSILSISVWLLQITFNQFLYNIHQPVCHITLSIVFGGIAISELAQTSNIKKSLFIFYLFTCLTILFFIQSRIGIIAFASCICMFIHKKIRIIILTISTICIILLFIQKEKSTLGRKNIYLTTVSMLDTPKQILFGMGADGFKSSYMPTQAEMLKTYSDEEKYLADNISHPLNEYLLLATNYGIYALVLIILVISSLLQIKNIKRSTMALLIAIALFSMFSYPFSYPITWIVLVWSLFNGNQQCKWNFDGYKYVYTISGIVCLYFSIYLFRLMEQWEQANKLRTIGKLNASHIIYKNIYNSPYYPQEFLYNYASFLLQVRKANLSFRILNECKINNYDTELLKGDIYYYQRRYSSAIKHYQKASEMCPNRFIPLYAMYLSSGLADKKQLQKILAQKILEKPIKIKSPTITKIINNVKQNNF